MAKFTALDEWWACLPTAQKERIATKAAKKAGKPTPVVYPECSAWWMKQTDETKAAICDHCTKDHGLGLEDWIEGYTFSY